MPQPTRAKVRFNLLDTEPGVVSSTTSEEPKQLMSRPMSPENDGPQAGASKAPPLPGSDAAQMKLRDQIGHVNFSITLQRQIFQLHVPTLAQLHKADFNHFVTEYEKKEPAEIILPDFKNKQSRRHMDEQVVESALRGKRF